MDDLTQLDNTTGNNEAKMIDMKLRSMLENKSNEYLPISIFMAEIHRDSVYKKLNYKSMRKYLYILSQEKGVKYSRILGWYNVGKIYLIL